MKKIAAVLLLAVILISAAAVAEEYDPLMYCGTQHFHAYAPAQFERFTVDDSVGIRIGADSFTFKEMKLPMNLDQIAGRYDMLFNTFRGGFAEGGELCASGEVNKGIRAKYEIFNKGVGLFGFCLFPGDGYLLTIAIYSDDFDIQTLERNAVALLETVRPINQ